MNAYYVQKADQIFPIFGVSSIEEAKTFVDPADHGRIVETDEAVYMHVNTGSVDFESGWDDFEAEADAGNLVEVEYSAEEEQWVEAE